MLLFIFTDILMLALGALLYLMVEALPRVAEEPSDRKSLLDRWIHSGIPERIDVALNTFLFKFLRKLRVRILKIDNALGRHLRRVKAEEEKPNAGFTDIMAESEIAPTTLLEKPKIVRKPREAKKPPAQS